MKYYFVYYLAVQSRKVIVLQVKHHLYYFSRKVVRKNMLFFLVSVTHLESCQHRIVKCFPSFHPYTVTVNLTPVGSEKLSEPTYIWEVDFVNLFSKYRHSKKTTRQTDRQRGENSLITYKVALLRSLLYNDEIWIICKGSGQYQAQIRPICISTDV